jgi:hypothetical protein
MLRLCNAETLFPSLSPLKHKEKQKEVLVESTGYLVFGGHACPLARISMGPWLDGGAGERIEYKS